MYEILEIDLSRESVSKSAWPADLEHNYLGGRGYNVWRLARDLSPRPDPLGPDNPLLFSCGLLTGTAAPASSRLHVNARSPLTGILGSSNLGGYIGARLRACGCESLAFTGRAERPVYLFLDGAEARLVDARPWWGLGVRETQEKFHAEHGGDRLEIMTIGPAGENLVPIACIMSGPDHSAGRTGLGAVMGSKNLKAVVVRPPDDKPRDTTSKSALEAARRYARAVTDAADFKFFSDYGGAGYVKWADDLGLVGAKNFQNNKFAGIDAIDGRKLIERKVRSRGCHRCPVQCKAELKFDQARWGGRPAHRPEFEPILNLGAKCGLADLETIVYLDNLCSDLGLDVISAGSIIGFAMDLFERGWLTSDEAGGIELRWGDGRAMETVLRQMASGRGLGELLGKGVREMARAVGRGSEALAPHVKGLELSGYHPGSFMSAALGYAVSSRGGDFNNVYSSLEHSWSPEQGHEVFGTPRAVDRRSIEGKGLLVQRAILTSIVLDCLGLCKVPSLSLIGRYDLELEAELASALTGREFSAEDLFAAGRRIADLERRINLGLGLTLEDDRLPEAFFRDPGGSLTAENCEIMLQDYYRAMGWDERGRPS